MGMNKSGMICAWQLPDDLPICFVSQAFVHMRRLVGCSATQRHACFDWNDVEKNHCGVCGALVRGIYDRKIHRVRDLSCGDARMYLEFELRRVWCGGCGAVKQEKLPWLADSPFYTKRFAFFVGKRCRTATISDVARELHLDWRAVKELDKQYMQEQLRRIGMPGPRRSGSTRSRFARVIPIAS